MKSKSPRIFYGWWIVVACFFIWLAITGVSHYGFTTLFEPMRRDFGWSYTQISLAASLRGMEVGFLSPITGFFTDRSGPRRLMFIGVVCLGMGLIMLSFTNSLWVFYASFILIGIGGSTCTGTVPMTTIANWFHRKIGIALGVMTCGAGFAGLFVPLIVKLMNDYGWRNAAVILGVGAFIIIMPLSLVVRHKPEQYGYLPDGDTEDKYHQQLSHPVRPQAKNITTKQALKSTTFWLIAISFIVYIIMINAVITHVMPFLNSVGVSRETGGLAVGAITLISIIGRLASGLSADRVDTRLVTSVNLVLMSLGFLCAVFVSTERQWVLIPFLFLFAISYGGNFTMIAAVVRQFFGRSNFGAISGLLMGLLAFGGVLGPLFAGMVVDRWGSYHFLWVAFTGMSALAILGIANARVVKIKKIETAEEP